MKKQKTFEINSWFQVKVELDEGFLLNDINKESEFSDDDDTIYVPRNNVSNKKVIRENTIINARIGRAKNFPITMYEFIEIQ